MTSKRHPLLAEITSALNGNLPETSTTISGVTYKMRLLKPEAEDWASSKTSGDTITAAVLSTRKPTLAAALLSINNVPVEQLFQLPDSMDLKDRERVASDPMQMRYWRREEILSWLREEQDADVLDLLYAAYKDMADEHRKAIQSVENFSKRTPSAS